MWFSPSPKSTVYVVPEVQTTEMVDSVSLVTPGKTTPKSMGLAVTEQPVSMLALTVKLPVLVAAWPRVATETAHNSKPMRRDKVVNRVFMVFPFENPNKCA
jgi:hypothetical protein